MNQRVITILSHDTDPIQTWRAWPWILALGAVLLALGFITLSMVTLATALSMVLIGMIILLAGAVQMFYALRYRHWKGSGQQTFSAVLYLLVGLMMIFKPFAASIVFTMIFALVLTLLGCLRLSMGWLARPLQGSWWWTLSGGLTLLLGVLILINLPEAAVWVIGLFIGIELVMAGSLWLLVALQMKRMV